MMKKLVVMTLAGMVGAFSVCAESFPEAVGGVITLPGDIARTYDEALPASATKLVKTGAAEATLTMESEFDGKVEVQAGTLTITQRNALGATSPIDVASSATFHLKKPVRPTGAGQNTCWFANPVTIRGTGVNGDGAFIYTSIDSTVLDDNALGTVILAADATISVFGRFGFSGKIDLAGYTLTRKSGNSTDRWMINNQKLVVTAGTIVNASGIITPQNLPVFSDAANTTLVMVGGELTPWNTSSPWPWNVTMRGGKLYPGSGGNKGENNVLAGTFRVDLATPGMHTVDTTTQADKSITLNGPVDLGNNGLNVSGFGKVYIGGEFSAGTVSGGRTIQCTDESTVVLRGNAVRVMPSGFGTYTTKDDGCPALWLTEGSLWTRVLRLGNGGGCSRGAFWQTGGTYANSKDDEGYIGESANTYGAYVLEGGTLCVSNMMRVASAAGSQGLFVQKGGQVRWGGSKSNPYFQIGGYGFGQFYMSGGTNDTCATSQPGSNHFLMGPHGGRATVTVTGPRTLLSTDGFASDTYGETYTNVLNVTDGATLSTFRLIRYPAAGTFFVVNADNGIIDVRYGSGFSNKGMWDAGVHDRDPDHFVIHSGGLVFDTSNCIIIQSGQSVPYVSEIPFHFDKPTGKRIKAIHLPTTEEFKKRIYGAPANVLIEGAGYGATAFADFDFDTAKLTGVVVTSGGCDYDVNTKAYVYAPSLNSATLPTRYECVVELEDCPKGGALTKRGTGELALYSRGNSNTYEGGTVVEGGTLTFYHDGSFPANTPLTVRKGASFGANGHAVIVSVLAGQGSVSAGGLTVASSLAIDASAFAVGATPLAVSGNVTFAAGATVNLTLTPEEVLACKGLEKVTILTATGTLNGSPTLLVNGQPDKNWKLSRSGNSLKVGWRRGLVLVVR